MLCILLFSKKRKLLPNLQLKWGWAEFILILLQHILVIYRILYFGCLITRIDRSGHFLEAWGVASVFIYLMYEYKETFRVLYYFILFLLLCSSFFILFHPLLDTRGHSDMELSLRKKNS